MKRRQTAMEQAIEAGMLPKAELKRRGWTESLISKLLGEHDKLIRNTNGGETQCFALARVEDAESGDLFQKHLAKFNAKQIERELEPIVAMWAKLTPAARTAFLMRLCGGRVMTTKPRYLVTLAILVACGWMALGVLAMLPRSRVTEENFDRIEIGMTPAEVEEILGELTSDWVGDFAYSLVWRHADNTEIWVE